MDVMCLEVYKIVNILQFILSIQTLLLTSSSLSFSDRYPFEGTRSLLMHEQSQFDLITHSIN